MMSSRAMSGSEIAILIAFVGLMGVVASKWTVPALGLAPADAVFVERLASFTMAAVILIGFPSLRRRVAQRLSTPIPPESRAEVALVVAIAALMQFALFGSHAVRAWAAGGEAALARIQLEGARGAGSAFEAATLRDLAITCLVAPLIEEIVYRGLLLPAWARTRGTWAAMILSSLVFAAVHLSFALPFFGGLLFAAVFLRTGSLQASILAHFCANAVLWYPLLGRFLVPAANTRLRDWGFHLACLAVIPVFILVYAFVASRSDRTIGTPRAPA